MDSDHAMQSLRRHGKSFFWASFFLPPQRREGAARLYALCRQLDDYADDLPPPQAQELLERVQGELWHGADRPITHEVELLQRDFGVPRAGVVRLIQALIDDTRPRSLESRGELLRFAYGVAGSVGLMMRPLLGATDRRAIPYAVDLGVAMQLTNIARDVLEDARRGRRYLPISDGSVTPQALLAGETLARERAWQEIQGVLELAHSYYRSADRGMVFIPLRSRIAIATAARIYESIGARILQLGPEAYWGERARVGALGKIQGTIRGLAHAMSMARPDRHDQALYQPFGDLLNEDAGTEWMN